MADKRDVVFGMALVGAATFAVGMWRIHRELQEMNDNLDAIRDHARGQHIEAMAQLEEEVEET